MHATTQKDELMARMVEGSVVGAVASPRVMGLGRWTVQLVLARENP